MKIDLSLDKIAIIVGFMAQLFVGVWWLSQLSNNQDNIMEELKKTERLQNQLTSQQETIFDLRYKLQLLEMRK
jgi:conjugal transfer/entry exclusion protein